MYRCTPGPGPRTDPRAGARCGGGRAPSTQGSGPRGGSTGPGSSGVGTRRSEQTLGQSSHVMYLWVLTFDTIHICKSESHLLDLVENLT